jgi:peptidoglycan-associated lipoprotein
MKNKFLCIGILSLSLMACASNQSANTTANQPPPSNPSDAVNISSNDADNTNINNNANADQATNSVYFGVDQYNVDNQYDSVIGYNANYLASHNAARVKVAGNTDDTGSVEYNLALGQRRADAVKKALIAKGANMNQIEAVSNGKLIAKFSNASDDGRAKNRRTDIIFTKQQPAGYHLDANGLPVVK